MLSMKKKKRWKNLSGDCLEPKHLQNCWGSNSLFELSVVDDIFSDIGLIGLVAGSNMEMTPFQSNTQTLCIPQRIFQSGGINKAAHKKAKIRVLDHTV